MPLRKPLEDVCAECGGTYLAMRTDNEAWDEARALFGVAPRSPGVVVVCDDCFTVIMRSLVVGALRGGGG